MVTGTDISYPVESDYLFPKSESRLICCSVGAVTFDLSSCATKRKTAKATNLDKVYYRLPNRLTASAWRLDVAVYRMRFSDEGNVNAVKKTKADV